MDDDFLGENVRIRQLVGFFEGPSLEPEDIEAGFVTVDEFVVIIARQRDVKRPL